MCFLKDISCVQETERRGAERFPVNIETEYCHMKDEKTGDVLNKGAILNISKTGLFLEATTHLLLGSVIVMMFEINWEDVEVPVGVVGTIVREQKNPAEMCEGEYCYGVKFNSPRMAV